MADLRLALTTLCLVLGGSAVPFDRPPAPPPPAAAVGTAPRAAWADHAWRLVALESPTGTVPVPVGTDLQISSEGRFQLHSCWLLTGPAVVGNRLIRLTNEFGIGPTCRGPAGRADHLIRRALDAPLAWQLHGTRLDLTDRHDGIVMRWRAADNPQPPLRTRQVWQEDGAGNCRVLAASTPHGPRLYALSRTRPTGPWRLLATGPQSAEDGPLLSPALDSLAPPDSRAARWTCTAGLVSARAHQVLYRAGGEPARTLPLRPIDDSTVAYTGVIRRDRPGRLMVIGGSGPQLGSWSWSGRPRPGIGP